MACCKVGLDRPPIPTAFVVKLFRWAAVSKPRRSAFRSARVSKPRRSTTLGLQVARRQSETAIAEDGRVRRTPSEPAFIFRVCKIRFPAPGSYAFILLVDGDIIAQRRVAV